MQHGKYKAKLYRKSWYIVWTEDKKTKRQSLKTKCRNTAERNFHEAVRQLEAPKTTFREVWDAWKEDKMNTQVQRATTSERHILPHFGNVRPDQINRLLCRGYIIKRQAQGISNGTIRRELGQARACVNWWQKGAGQWELPPAPAPKERYLTREEYKKLLDASDGHIKMFIQLAIYTAGRKTALLELTWDRVDFERRIIRLATQDQHGRKGRATVPIGNLLHAELAFAYENRTCEYVIEYAGGNVLDIKKGFAGAVKRAGLEGVSPHVLRHTAAVWLAEAGRPMSEIAQYLGHTDSRITERVYARYSPQYLMGCADALEGILEA